MTAGVHLARVLDEHVRSRGREEAFVCGEHRLDWAGFDHRVARCAALLQQRGVGPGDRVAWIGQNCHRFFEVLFATVRLGALFAPCNWRQQPAELAFVVDDLAPRVVVWQHQDLHDVAVAARDLAVPGADWIAHDGEYEALLAGAPPGGPTVDGGDDGAALIVYTAAFDGRPNGAVLTHRGLLTQALVLSLTRGIEPGTVFLSSGPLFHLATLVAALATVVIGGTSVVVPKVDAPAMADLIEVERCTRGYLPAAVVPRLLEVADERPVDLRSLSIPPTGTPLDDLVTVDRRRGAGRGYGQTETTGLVTWLAYGGAGAHGRPPPGVEVRIVDEEGADVAPDAVGEILVRGPLVMAGYWNRPELNAARHHDGWHRTNDLGRRHADGSLSFVGSMGHLIKCGSENVYPAEVEACLRSHAAVRDCGVVGVPHPKWTQVVHAVVVLHDGAAASEADLIDHCRGRIAGYKRPAGVSFVDELPRRDGAVDHDAVDRLVGGGGYPGKY